MRDHDQFPLIERLMAKVPGFQEDLDKAIRALPLKFPFKENQTKVLSAPLTQRCS